MSAPNTTPGPWRATCEDVTGDRKVGDDGLRFWSVNEADGRYRGAVCNVHCAEHIQGITIVERDANAHLIAAAPELFAALDDFLDEYVQLVNSGDAGNWDPEKEPKVIAARAALAKARGDA